MIRRCHRSHRYEEAQNTDTTVTHEQEYNKIKANSSQMIKRLKRILRNHKKGQTQKQTHTMGATTMDRQQCNHRLLI